MVKLKCKNKETNLNQNQEKTMSYQVKALQTATHPKRVGETPKLDNWVAGMVDSVDESLIQFYRDHTDVFTILSQNGAAPTTLEAITGLTAVDNTRDGFIHQVTYTLADVTIAVTDALAYASKKIFTFPKGRIALLGAVASLQFGVTTARASTINDSASLTWSLGSAAASNITLSSTMIDMLAKATTVLDGAVAAYTATATKGALAAGTQFDGTGTATPVYLNVGFETNTDIDADGTLKAKGTIVLTYVNLGGG
jgi:hypothetical protein